MKKMFPKCFLLAFLVCTVLVSCSDDDDNITQNDIEGFWRFSYADDPMLRTTWVDSYMEFTNNGVLHKWAKMDIEYFMYIGCYQYEIKGNKLCLTGKNQEKIVYTTRLKDKNELEMKDNDGYRSTYMKFTKPDGLPYE